MATMDTLIITFILIQTILLVIMPLHDWVHLPPLTDVHELKKHHSITDRLITSIIFAITIATPLLLTILYRSSLPLWVIITLVLIYGMISLGTVFSWWIPYLFGSPAQHKTAFAEYRFTHRFLPARDDNVIPNTFHVILHLHIWACWVISLYLLFNYFIAS